MKLFSLVIGCLLLALGLLSPAVIQAQPVRMSLEQLPPATVVSETGVQLTQDGCQPQTFTNETRSFLLDSETPYPVVPADFRASGGHGEIFFCSRATVDSLTVQGKVAQAQGQPSGAQAEPPSFWSSWKNPLQWLDYAGGFVVTRIAELVNMVMTVAAMAVSYFLDYGTFLTNPVVQTAWPFVLGVANLGFVLALLFIALSTILRIESFQAKRALPRLLIAALLINFSLIIAVLILDASRLVMAVIANGIAQNPACHDSAIACLGANVLKNSGMIQQGFTVGASADGPWTSIDQNAKANVAEAARGLLLMALLTMAYVVMGILLAVRWFALIILLALSPLAYLFVALPGTAQYARKWWQLFIKYVVYGPVIVFILAVFTQAQGPINNALRESFNKTPMIGKEVAGAMTTAIAAAFLFGAAAAGGYLGMMGGSMAANMFKGVTKGAAKGIYVGTGTRRVVRTAREVWRPLPKAFRIGLRHKLGRVGKLLGGVERDERGEPLHGERTWGERMGQILAGKLGESKMTQFVKWETQIKKAGTSPSELRDPNGAYSRINIPVVGTAMGPHQAEAMINLALTGEGTAIEKVADFERLKVLVSNPYAYNNIEYADRARLAAINTEDTIDKLNKKLVATGEKELDSKQKDELKRWIREMKDRANSSLQEVIKDHWV